MIRWINVFVVLLLMVSCAGPLNDERPTVEGGPPAVPTIAPTVAPAVPLMPAPPQLFPSAIPLVPRTPPAAPPAAAAPDDLERIAAATPALRDQVALGAALKGLGAIPRVERTTPRSVKVGDVEIFWVADPVNSTNYTVTAELRYAGSVALVYVDTSLRVEQPALERSAREFEERIYPRNRSLFGTERSPGVDADSRLTILNTRLRGAAGYFSSSDEAPQAINRFSNEREMFVMGLNAVPFGTEAYASTLAHEYQHMIHQNQQPRSPLWFNEGMSTIAQDVNGFLSDSSPLAYLRDPNVQLTGWSDLEQALPHYGAAQLFLRYVKEHYAGEQGLTELIKADAGNRPEAFVDMARRKRPNITDFSGLVADWAVANLINNPAVGDGRFAYQLLPRTVRPQQVSAGSASGEIHQFGAAYLELPRGPAMLDFSGETTVGLAGAQPHSGRTMWWSNRGDESVSTLTRAVDLRRVERATLRFAAWYELEQSYDYAFITVSDDGGQTWRTLQGTMTTTDDPQGQNYGNALNSVSGAPGAKPGEGTRGVWVDERIDLSVFAGKEVLLRFLVVNDAGLNYPGLLLDDLRIPEIGYTDDVEGGDAGWQAQGFVRTSGVLPQGWTVRLVREGPNGMAVESVVVGVDGRASVNLGEGERGVLVVLPSTPYTSELARYRYTVQ
jgi:hypothetical protein